MRRTYLLLCVVVALTYSNSLSGSWHFDDTHSIVDNPHIRSLSEVPRYFVDPACFSYDPGNAMYRPLLLVTYALNYAVGGYDVTSWHVTNVALHALNACLVAWVGVLLGLPGLFAGLLFAVHPLVSEPVNYISARSDSLCAFFVLLTIGLHVKASRWAWLTFVVALLCKEWAVVTPGLCWLADRGMRGGWGWQEWWPYGALTGAYVAVLVATGFLGGSLDSPVRPLGEQLGLQARALCVYVKLLCFPTGLSIEHSIAGISAWAWLCAVLLALGVLLGLVALLGGSTLARPMSWAQASAALVLLPTILMPLNCIVAERRWYLVVGFLALGLSPWMARSIWTKRVTVAACCILAVLTFRHNRVWADELSLWSAADPEQPRVQLYLGNAHAARAMAGEDTAAHWSAARMAFQHAWALDPVGTLGLRALHNLGSVRFTEGDLTGAMQTYRLVLDRDPEYVDAWLNLGLIAWSMGDSAQAHACYARAQECAGYRIGPRTTTAWR